MTVQAQVEAAAVTLEDLRSLEAGTSVLLNGLTAAHEATWSPTRNEVPADYCVFADDADPALVQVMHYAPRGILTEAPFPVSVAASTVAGIVDAIAERGAPVCRFATGMELSNDGWDVVPCVSVWTGPVTDAAEIPAAGMSPDLHSGRVRFRGLLSHRVNAVEDAGVDPWERLRLQQLPGTGEWVLQSGAHVSELVHEHTRNVHTLEDVLLWAQGWLHIAYDADGPVAPTGFTVSAVEPGAPLTVRIW
ncbi:hypothetical protein [Curtobacterium sp. UNCCL17]|uniref:hypothetical protein n=1 Tax=Curtobacterium sp. UNCCL17 TaxID=1449051 RepID=UPI000483BD82|nr:hypothetical protein [Curtobacterium sp. UNCCL17]